jgi:hypothetical protein
VLKGLVELVYGLWSKSISNFWARKADSNHPEGVVTVVADIGQFLKTGNGMPEVLIKGLGNRICHAIRLIGCTGRK